jgi:TATA-box binding protein (TBP) (component of TFIID and TFIIIB)
MGRMKDFYENVENLVYEAIEHGANTTDDIHAYVTQYVPSALVSFKLVEDIAIEYSSTDTEYEPDNVY